MKIRYTEAFLSIQGEGRFVGVPSVFLRTFGCPFKCAGFGMPRGQLSTEVDKINPDDYNKLNDLPMVETGCDSYVSWHPKFKKFSDWKDVEEISEILLALTPNNIWEDTHLIFTGGEPLLWQKQIMELLRNETFKTLRHITFETNTTRYLSIDFVGFLSNLSLGIYGGHAVHITWSCSPKLSISGESWKDAINPQVAASYASVPNSHLYFKFVIGDDKDLGEVKQAVSEFRAAGNSSAPVYLMPVGATVDGVAKTEKVVAEICLREGFRFSPRLHVNIFGNKWAT